MIDQNFIVNTSDKDKREWLRLATVASVVTGGVTLRFDGDDSAGQKKYKYIGSYSPTVGHRVVVAEIGGSWLVLGAIGAGGTGNVNGPASANTGNMPMFGDPTGKVLEDSGILAEDLANILSPWSDWPPTLGNITLGNGTRIAKYKRVGKKVEFELSITLGSTSAITGDVSFALPSIPGGIAQRTFPANLYDASSFVRYAAIALVLTNGNVIIRYFAVASGTYLNPQLLSATAPFTWATGDVISVIGYYLEN